MLGIFTTLGAAHAAETAAPSDPYLWLEDVHGARATAWVQAQNAKSLDVLQNDLRYAGLYADALKIAQNKDRIPNPVMIDGGIYNFWQDAEHVRGIWRFTTPSDYADSAPRWNTALDVDALAKMESANWVWHGADCAWPSERRCLVSLSDGGEDADTIREFDLPARRFVPEGIVLPHGKQRAAWEDLDSVLVAREWAPGDVTASGYPFIVKRLRRGQPLSAAIEVFRGSASDGGYGVSPLALHDGEGHRALIIQRPLSTFTFEYYLLTQAGPRKLDVPLKSEPSAMFANRLLFTLAQDWTVDGTAYAQGSLVAFDLAAAMADPAHLKPSLVYAPGARESLSEVAATRSHLLVTTYENVKGRAFVYAAEKHAGWSRLPLALPDDASLTIAATNQHEDRAYLNVTSFLEPTTLWLNDTRTGDLKTVKALAPQFDASRDVVEQHEAASKDGTLVPYFIVRPKDMALDGSNPTLLYAYGGFAVSLTPTYSALDGKLWLEHGGVYVLANIRGGGEFGPAWHEAGLTTHRQRIYDDFAAVAQDLIARKITSPARLGIEGGSNGGLLMGVEFTQHPELYRAVDIQVPLLDMLRFEHIAAGTSWVGEYGSVSDPEQRVFLASISPYNNLRAGVAYPEPFIWTTTKDDRVGPQHARKFAAKLSALGIPYLFYEVTEGGHGAGANLIERAHTAALEMTYFFRQLVDSR